MKLRVCGVYDGMEYRHYYSIADFLANEMTSKNRGAWFFAHAGGLADVQFVFEELCKSDSYRVAASFSGSSAIIVTVTRGKNCWHFVDSFWLLRAPLSEIAKWIGSEKTGPDKEIEPEKVKEWYANIDMATLVKYNEQDCWILWHAIHELQCALLSFGGQLQRTLASCAMHLFRRCYLSSPVGTSEFINDVAREAYFASRVEDFNNHASNCYYFDVNSSFPYAMTFPAPGEYICELPRLPDHYVGNPNRIYMANVDLEVHDCYLPPVPVRVQERVFFPMGRWKGWLSSVDLELAVAEGARIHGIEKVIAFEPFHDLASYAKDLYAKRKAAGTEFEKQTYKLLLNSLYGKFAEFPLKEKLHIHPNETTLARVQRSMQGENPTARMLFPGAFLESVAVPIPHCHVPISVHITSIARRTLYNFLCQAGTFHYCDTDGFSATEMLETSSELGGLKLEKKIKDAKFIAPKVYRIDGQVLNKKGEWEDTTYVKAKGFSLGRNKAKAIERFETLLQGREISVERMQRVRELFKNGVCAPTEKVIWKALRGTMTTKRLHYPDGTTRPWTYEELKGLLK